ATSRELVRVGFGSWALALVLVVLGIVAVWRAGLRVAALLAPLEYLALVAAAAAHRYPFLDDRSALSDVTVRTNLFLTVTLPVLAGAGVAFAVAALWRNRRTVPLALLAAAVALAG